MYLHYLAILDMQKYTPVLQMKHPIDPSKMLSTFKSVSVLTNNKCLIVATSFDIVKLICTRLCLMAVSFCHLALTLSLFVALTPALSLPFQFDSEELFNSSVKTLLSHLPKQRYLKSICDEIHHFKITKRCVGCFCPFV